jgi:predicted O-linked N-acetylglucosamine transferase (SPINDLY family)
MLSFLADALALHTRGRGVRVTAVSLRGAAAHRASAWRRRVRAGAGAFVEAGAGASDAAVAELVNRRRVGVAVFLDGHNSGARLGVAAARPAPIQARADPACIMDRRRAACIAAPEPRN